MAAVCLWTICSVFECVFGIKWLQCPLYSSQGSSQGWLSLSVKPTFTLSLRETCRGCRVGCFVSRRRQSMTCTEKKTLKHTLQNYIIKVHSVEMFHGTGQQLAVSSEPTGFDPSTRFWWLGGIVKCFPTNKPIKATSNENHWRLFFKIKAPTSSCPTEEFLKSQCFIFKVLCWCGIKCLNV